jgi:hypothetical protein
VGACRPGPDSRLAGVDIHWDAVGHAVAEAFRQVSAALADSDFYLAEGTALALRLGHRESVDLDLFSPSFSAVDDLRATLGGALPSLAVTSTAPRTLYTLVEGVQASFFGYGYPTLAPPETPGPGLLPLASIPDIAAMKLAAIASRGSRKAFVDLAFILKDHMSLEEALAAFREKYAMTDPGHVVRALVYFDDAEIEPDLRMLRSAPWAEVKESLRQSVEALLGLPGPRR